MRQITCCYLCGEILSGNLTRDHVPPQMFFPKPLRTHFNLDDLATLPTHKACNESYRHDEEYFAYTFAPLVMDSFAGQLLVEEIGRRFRNGTTHPLIHKVFQEFEHRPSGLHLPGGKIVKRSDAGRVERVVWKITRGLFFMEIGRLLPESTAHVIHIVTPGDMIPGGLGKLLVEVSRGKYPAVFDHKFRVVGDGDPRVGIWATLFWSRLMAFTLFAHPIE